MGNCIPITFYMMERVMAEIVCKSFGVFDDQAEGCLGVIIAIKGYRDTWRVTFRDSWRMKIWTLRLSKILLF